MNGDELFELYNVFKELHERVECLEKLVLSRHSFTSLEFRTPIGNLKFDLHAQMDKYLELYQKF